MNSIFKRKSVRKFKNQKISDEKIISLLKAGMQAPSAHNSQPWEFLIISDRKDIEEVSTMSPYAKPGKNADKLIITLTNIDKINAKKTNDWFTQDMSACTENILIQAVEEGLGGVWLGFYPSKERVNKVKKYFNLPDNIIPFSVIALGYSDDKKDVEDRFSENKIHFGKY